MKKFVAFCGSLGLFLLNHPMTALAAEEAAGETAASAPVALRALCRAPFMHRSPAAFKGRVVGSSPAPRRCFLVAFIYACPLRPFSGRERRRKRCWNAW